MLHLGCVMSKGLVARASIPIRAPAARVWDALTDPAIIKQYMFGAEVVSDWRPGSKITWRGEWQGRGYEDHGIILRFQPQRLIEYSHFSPLAGLPDLPENYHTVTVELTGRPDSTLVTLTQDNNSTEAERKHSEENWKRMLGSLRETVEKISAKEAG